MKDKIKKVLKVEGISWAKLAELNGSSDRSNLKKNVERWGGNLEKVFKEIGYEIELKKIK